MTDKLPNEGICDVLVIGSGASGLSAAITARKAGLDVIVLEKEPEFGGTTAYSGGILWIPGNPQAIGNGIRRHQGRRSHLYQARDRQPLPGRRGRVVPRRTGRRCSISLGAKPKSSSPPTLYPDYHPDAPGGVLRGRSVVAAPYDARRLGPDLARLKPPLRTITFMGMMFNSSNADLKHFFNATTLCRLRRVRRQAPGRAHGISRGTGAACS